ncbi:MAG: hypothetical protein R6X32_01605 [Chloroflexota bacterium]
MNESEYTLIRKYDLTQFANLITRAFSLEDINTALIFPLGLDGEVPGTTLSTHAKELVTACDRRGMLPMLMTACQQERPGYDWDSVIKDSEPKPFAPEKKVIIDKRSQWLIVVGFFTVMIGAGSLGWWMANGRNGPPPSLTEIPIFANVKERFDFETTVDTDPLADWKLETCPTLDTSQCGWVNANDRLSVAPSGFSGENSLQVAATLVNTEQIYSTEKCFDPTLLDGISASIHIPSRETNRQALAATKIQLSARPQEDTHSLKQWPISILDLKGLAQPGWYHIALDLRQVADERRQPYNTLLVDCIHLDFILPVTAQNEQVMFHIDDVALYRVTSSHIVDGYIPPRGIVAEETFVSAPAGAGIIFNFEEGVLDTDVWSASDSQGPQPITVSTDVAYDGVYALQFSPDLVERDGASGGKTFCLRLNGDEVTLQNRIVISRLFIPEDAPYNLSVQYNLTKQDFYPSWENSAADRFDVIKPGWNTFAWYTADAREWVDGQDLRFCVYLTDRKAEDADKNSFRGTLYLDRVELIPYHYTHASHALKTVNYYAFDSDNIGRNLTVLPGYTTNVNPRFVFADEGIEALHIELDLPAAGEAVPTSNNSTGLVIATNDQPVEALFTMIFVPELADGSLMITFEGIQSNGEEVSQTFPLVPGQWTPIFWPVRSNDFDNVSYTAATMQEINVLITSTEAYAGPIYFDYLAVYRRFPKQ